jgi:CMP-N-acetylneuraminic acid synthetase
VVSTDSKDIINVVKEYDVIVRERPVDLANDNVHAVNVVVDCINYYDIDMDSRVFMLLPTAPLRTSLDIDNACAMFDYYDCTSVVGVCKCDKPESNFRYIGDGMKLFPLKEVEHFETQRQDIKNIVYEVNGTMFAATKQHLLQHNSFHQGNPVAYVMSKIASLDINDMEDFKMVEAILCQK